MRRISVLVAVAAVAIGVASPAATDCVTLKPRKTYAADAFRQHGAVIFAGTVISVNGGSVRFNVREAFKGIHTGNRTLDFFRGLARFRFEVGEQLLVYARSSPYESLLSTECSRTAPLDERQDDLRELRQLVRRQGLEHAFQHRGSY